MNNPERKLEEFYNKFNKEMCLYPFFGAFYQTNDIIASDQDTTPNSVRPCSLIMNPDDRWYITDNNIHNSRNNEHWKQMRQDFIDGKYHELPDCSSCSYNEKSGTTSPRMQNNKFLFEFLDIDIANEVQNILDNNNTVDDIYTLDYYPSNYCNYACIMCAGGASSKRHTFEVKFLNYDSKIVIKDADPDFLELINNVKIINFTGGETVLQKQVFNVMDYLIQEDKAKDITVTLLTNASSSPIPIMPKLEKFANVVYNISIDGIGAVGEYQRRGSKWTTVEANALEIWNHPKLSSVVNFVITAVNVLNFVDFVDWCHNHKIGPMADEYENGSFINVSPVFRVDHLGQAAVPTELRELALSRLYTGKEKYQKIDNVLARYHVGVIQRAIDVIESTPFHQAELEKFIEHIKIEDKASQVKFVDAVPEWRPYF